MTVLPPAMTMTSIQPEQYQAQLDTKVAKFKNALSNLPCDVSTMDIFTSPDSHYRMRAEFKVWHDGDIARYAMHDQATKKPIFLDTFPVACERINILMPKIMQRINENELLRKKLFQIEFLSTTTGDTLVSFIYHKPLDEAWISAIASLKDTFNIQIVGRSRKQKLVLDRDYVNETLTVNRRPFHYRQYEGSFTQPNAAVCEKMLSWAVNQTLESSGDLLELYCGNGNFTLPLSQNFHQVIATEISKASVNAAHYNLEHNAVNNVTLVRMSSEDFADAMDKVRPFRRLKDIDLESYTFSTVFVDPPRAGLDDHTLEIIQRFNQILYISCNPDTLVHNLETLCKTHEIKQLAAFDQFPYTEHLEAGVLLQRKA